MGADQRRSGGGARHLPVHLDGARLFNAGAHLGRTRSDGCAIRSTRSGSRSPRGLARPVGAIFGRRAFALMKKARPRRADARRRHAPGRPHRRAGASSGCAIRIPQHARDDALAQRLAHELARSIPRWSIRPGCRPTSSTAWSTAMRTTPPGSTAHLSRTRRARQQQGPKIRFVTHAQVDEADVDAAVRRRRSPRSIPA